MADNNTKIIISARDETVAAFSSVKSGISSLSNSYAALSGLITGAVIGGTISLIKKNIDLADGLNDLSKKYGASVETLAGFSLAAEQSGTSMEAIAKGMNKLSVELTTSPERFQKLGISTTSATEAMIQMADIFAAMPDGAEKTALAVSLFGKSGADLIPLLDEGSAGMRKMIETGGELSRITSENAKQADEFNDNLALIKASSEGAGMAIAKDLLPWLKRMTDEFLSAKKAGLGLIDSLREIGLRSPGNTNRENIRAIDEEIASLDKKLQRQKEIFGNSQLAEQFQSEIDRKKKAREYFAERERSDALGTKDSYGNESRGLGSPPVDPLEAKKNACILAKGTWDGKKCIRPGGATAAKESRTSQPESYADRIAKSVGSAISGSDLVKAREYAATVEALDALFFNTGLDADIYSSAMDKLTKSHESSIQPTKTLVELFQEENATAIARVNQQREMIGMREKDVAVLEATRKMEDAAAEARKNAFRDIKDPALYQQTIEGINAELEVQKKEMADATASVYDYAHSWESGATDALGKYLDEVENMASKSDQLVSHAFHGMEDALVSFVKTGKLDFSSMADSIISDLIRIQIQQSIMQPLTQAMSGSGGFISAFAGLFGGSSAAASGGNAAQGFNVVQKNGGVWDDGIQEFARGGTFTNSVVDRPTLFPFAKGTGLMGEAGPEAIMPLTRAPGGELGVRAVGGGGGSANVTINIIESPGNGGKQQQRSDGGGNKIIDVFVEQVKGSIASDITRGSGAIPAALGSTYGLNRSPGTF